VLHRSRATILPAAAVRSNLITGDGQTEAPLGRGAFRQARCAGAFGGARDQGLDLSSPSGRDPSGGSVRGSYNCFAVQPVLAVEIWEVC
jgi:hypothetical protein